MVRFSTRNSRFFPVSVSPLRLATPHARGAVLASSRNWSRGQPLAETLANPRIARPRRRTRKRTGESLPVPFGSIALPSRQLRPRAPARSPRPRAASARTAARAAPPSQPAPARSTSPSAPSARRNRRRTDRQRLVLNVADHMRALLQHHLAAANRPLDPAVDDHAVGLDPAHDRGLGRDDERGAMQIPVDMPVDLDQTLGRDRADDLQTLGNDGPLTLEQPHDTLLTQQTDAIENRPPRPEPHSRLPSSMLPPNSCRHRARNGVFSGQVFLFAPRTRKFLAGVRPAS